MAAKWNIEKFSGENDFGLWKIKMEAILTQFDCVDAIKEEAPAQVSGSETEKEGEAKTSSSQGLKERAEQDDKARSAIILCLSDKVLREVAKEKTAASMWKKLESLYMTKSLANRLCLKQQLYGFRMTESKSVLEQISEFNKILDDLENIEVKLEDEDKALLLLNSLPKAYEHFKETLIYGKDKSISLDDVLTAIRTKELQKLQETKISADAGEVLNAAGGRSEKRGQHGKKPRSKSKGSGKADLKCFYCKKPGHFKKDCPERENDSRRPEDTVDLAASSDGYDSAGVLMVSAHGVGA